MKSFHIATAIALAIATTAALAQSGAMKGMEGKDTSMKGMDMKDKSGASMSGDEKNQNAHHGSGVVKILDTKAGTVTIAHGPIKTMNWSAMTMTFKVKDKDLLDKLGVDKKVDFDFVKQGKDYVVTAVK